MIRCWKQPRQKESRSNFPAVTVGMRAWALPSEHPVYPQLTPCDGAWRTSILNNINGSGHETLGWGGSFAELNNKGVLIRRRSSPFLVGAEEERAFTSPNPPGKRVFPGLAGRFRCLCLGRSLYWRPHRIDGEWSAGRASRMGGYYLASPIFTALWAIANQYACDPLGQAALTIAGLKPGELVDVLPTSASPT